MNVTNRVGETPPVASAGRWAAARHILFSPTDRAQSQRNAIIALLVRCISAALLYVSQVILARWMGATEYGIFVVVWTFVLMLGVVASLGLNLGIMRLIGVYRQEGDTAALRGAINGSRLLSLAVAALIAGSGALCILQFPDLISPRYAPAALLVLLCVPFYALTDVQDGIGRGHGWMAAALMPPYLVRPLLILLIMVLAIVSGWPMVAATAALAAVIATCAAGLIQALWINRRMFQAYGAGPQTFAPRFWIATSFPLLAIAGCEILLQNTDIIVLSRLMTPADVAIYFAAGKTMSLIMFVHYAVGSAMAKRFASFKERSDEAGLRACVREAVNWTFWPSLAAALAILALGKPLLSLFGPQFVSGYPVMAILVIGFLTRAAMGPAEYLLNMQGEQRLCALVMIAAAVLNVVLNFVLVPLYGMTGAAMATATALAFAALANGLVARLRLGINVAIWSNLPLRLKKVS